MRLLRKTGDVPKRTLWQRIKDIALMDVSTIARGGVTVAFSTAGRAPALAGLLREAFDELVPADIDAWAERASLLSREQRADEVPMPLRRPQLLEALNRLYESRRRA